MLDTGGESKRRNDVARRWLARTLIAGALYAVPYTIVVQRLESDIGELVAPDFRVLREHPRSPTGSRVPSSQDAAPYLAAAAHILVVGSEDGAPRWSEGIRLARGEMRIFSGAGALVEVPAARREAIRKWVDEVDRGWDLLVAGAARPYVDWMHGWNQGCDCHALAGGQILEGLVSTSTISAWVLADDGDEARGEEIFLAASRIPVWRESPGLIDWFCRDVSPMLDVLEQPGAGWATLRDRLADLPDARSCVLGDLSRGRKEIVCRFYQEADPRRFWRGTHGVVRIWDLCVLREFVQACREVEALAADDPLWVSRVRFPESRGGSTARAQRVLSGSVWSHIGADVRRRLACWGISLRLHRMETGSYPQSLDEVRGADRLPPPVDLFTGAPLRYRREGEGFVLYSVGPDGDDDGGNDWKLEGRGHADYVFRLTR